MSNNSKKLNSGKNLSHRTIQVNLIFTIILLGKEKYFWVS